MAALKALTVVVGLLGVSLFWLNEPLPPGTANPGLYKFITGFMKLHTHVGEFQAWWSGEDFRIIDQNNLENMALSQQIYDPDVLVTEEVFASVQVFVYQPKTKKNNRPALVYIPGGGFRTGHPLIYDSLLHKFVKQLDIVVVAIRYRLTPKVKAPVPHEDCEKATQHFFINAEKYGVNPNLVGVAGDSAGGNIAASLSLILRDQGEDQFAFQLIIYPWVQALDLKTSSHQRNLPTAMVALTEEALSTYLGSFLGLPPRVFSELSANRHVKPETWEKYKKYFNIDEIPKKSIPANYKPVRPDEINQAVADFVEDDITNPYLWPLLADDLTDLPPAYVLTVENDPIRDEGIWYANRLRKAGNKVLYEHSPDGFHGMIGMQYSYMYFDPAVKAADSMIAFSKGVLDGLKKDLESAKVLEASTKQVEAKTDKKKDKTTASVVDDIKKLEKPENVPKAGRVETVPKSVKEKQDSKTSKTGKAKGEAIVPKSQSDDLQRRDDKSKEKAEQPKKKVDVSKKKVDVSNKKVDGSKKKVEESKQDKSKPKPQADSPKQQSESKVTADSSKQKVDVSKKNVEPKAKTVVPDKPQN